MRIFHFGRRVVQTTVAKGCDYLGRIQKNFHRFGNRICSIRRCSLSEMRSHHSLKFNGSN
ncbi:hypothetical protein [Nostoc sp.]|uniref:hypothetical protein n=1 Tax=Nostoc sp. TaxID=1180 RepID=UPI002FF86D3B